MEILTIPVDGGMVRNTAMDAAPENSCWSCVNITPKAGGYTPSPGYYLHSVRPSASSGGATELAVYTNEDAAVPVRLLARCGTRVFASTNAGCTFDGSEILLDTVVHATNRVRLAQFGDSLFFVDGNGAVKKVFGFTSTTQTATSPDDLAGGIGTGDHQYSLGPWGLAVDADDNIWVADRNNNRVHLYTNVAGTWTFIDSFTGSDGGGSPGACITNPVGVAVDATYVYVALGATGASYKVVVLYRTTGGGHTAGDFYARWVGSGWTGSTDAVNACGSIVVDSTAGEFYIGADASGTGYRYVYVGSTVTGAYVRKFGENGSGNGQFFDPPSLGYYRSGGTVYIYAADAARRDVQKLSSTGVWQATFAGGTQYTAAFVSGTNLFLGHRAGVDKYSLSSLTRTIAIGSYGSALGSFSECYGVGALAAGTLVTSDRGNYRIQLIAETATEDPTDVWELSIDYQPVTEPTVVFGSDTGDTIPRGEWEFCYTFSRWTYDKYVESKPSPITTYTVQDDNEKFTVTPYVTGNAIVGDLVKLYVRGPVYAAFTLVHTQTVGSGPSASAVSLIYDDEAAFGNEGYLNEYQVYPPSKATFCFNDGRGRMVYGVGSRAYFSNVNEPEYAPEEWFDDTTAAVGGWIDITGGPPLTGGCSYPGGYLFFSEKSVWRVSGETALQDFGKELLHAGIGCCSHETIVQTEEGIWWFDGTTVWAWAGAGDPVDVGRAVSDQLVAYTVNGSSAIASATYCPDTRRYILSLPVSTVVSGPSSGANGYYAVFHFTEKAWSLSYYGYNTSPRHFVKYFAEMPTQGLYLSDYQSHIYREGGGLVNFTSDPGIAYNCSRGTKSFRFPSGRFGEIRKVIVHFVGENASTQFSLALGYNDRLSYAYSPILTATNSAGGVGYVVWQPGRISNVRDFSIDITIGVNQSGTPTTEIRAIEVWWQPKGFVR